MRPQPTLWTRNFIAACAANFLLFFAFYLLLPILPLYLMDVFQSPKSIVGAILSCYTVAALFIRPFSGYLLDTFQRKPIFLFAFITFTCIFGGYAAVSVLWMFIILRALHGLTFGLVTTASNTVVVDILPSQRRGEGLGFFGVANNIAMAIGPMTGLFLVNHYPYTHLFYLAMGIGLIGCIVAACIQVPQKVIVPTDSRPLHSYDRFLLVKGIPAGICLLLHAIPYGVMTSFIAVYGKELGITSGLGAFFSCMAIGLIGTRLFAGRLVDRGWLTQVITVGCSITSLSYFSLSGLKLLHTVAPDCITPLFFTLAIFIGIGYGLLFPAFNTLFVNLAPHNRRATASSTYLTSWDIGIGIGLTLGGCLADTAGGLSLSFCAGATTALIGLVLFVRWAAPHFLKNKLR